MRGGGGDEMPNSMAELHSLLQSLSTTGGGDLQQVEDLMIMEAMRLSMNNEGAEGAPSAGAPAARDGVPAAAPTNPARPSAARSAQSAVALAVAAAAEDAMHAHDSDDDGDGGASPGHGLRGPSPGASPAMSPALQGLSGLAESFSPEQIPVDEDEQMMLAIALSLNASQTPTQTPTLSPAQPPHGTLSPGAAVAGMEPAAAPVSAPASV